MPCQDAKADMDIAIIGGGAAGLATAIFAARLMPTRPPTVLDGAEKLGTKILISGGGRCNITNRVVAADDFCGGSRNVIRRVLTAFPIADTVAFFREIGIELREESDGKLFPKSNRASSVIEAMMAEAARLGVRILTGQRVTAVRRGTGGFQISTGATALSAGVLVLATGGRSFPKTGSDGFGYRLAESLGHTLIPQTPALAPLILDGDFHRPLSGVSHPVELTLRAAGSAPVRVRGDLLWTHFGISGPAVLDLSRHWHRAHVDGRAVTVSANLLPGQDARGVDARLLAVAAARPRVQLRSALADWIPARVAVAVLSAAGVSGTTPLAHLSKELRRMVVNALVGRPLPVHDSRGYAHAEATAGGVPLTEVEPGGLASRKCRGLYFAGEILDVDGRIGGFNFQWAWASARVVAAALARAGDVDMSNGSQVVPH